MLRERTLVIRAATVLVWWTNVQAEQPLTEDLYREKGKENPGQAGYGGSNARASLAFPTAANHRSRTGRPVFVRAAAGMQVSRHSGNWP